MLAVLETVPTAMQGSRFFPSGGRNHRKYSLHRPTAEWPGWLARSIPPKEITNPSTNRTWCSLTLLA